LERWVPEYRQRENILYTCKKGEGGGGASNHSLPVKNAGRGKKKSNYLQQGGGL